jgi:hypothetical protein
MLERCAVSEFEQRRIETEDALCDVFTDRICCIFAFDADGHSVLVLVRKHMYSERCQMVRGRLACE